MPTNDDTAGRKPYNTYRSRRSRPSSRDEELMARPAAQPSSRHEAPASVGAAAHEDRGTDEQRHPTDDQRPPYRRYTSTERSGGQKRRPAASKNGTGGRRRRRLWVLPVSLVLAVAIAAVVLAVLAWPGYATFNRAVQKSNDLIDAETRAQLDEDEGAIWRKGTTVLLFGVDTRAEEPARSDTILLMRFNPGSHTVNKLSIPRDTRVAFPQGTYDKINAAMYWGGPAMATKVVKDYLGIAVNHVMVVDFNGFKHMVDAVGGVDLYVPKTVSTVAGGDRHTVVFEKGMQHMNGTYATLYVRIRYADDDIHRAERQQQFLQALQDKLIQPSNIRQLPDISEHFMSGVATDLTTGEILQLGYLQWRAKGGTKAVLTGTPGWEGGISYIFPPSEQEKRKVVRKFLST